MILSSLVQSFAKATHLQQLGDTFHNRLRQFAITAAAAVVGLFFFCSGILMAVFHAAQQFDMEGRVSGSAVIWAGLGLSMAPILALSASQIWLPRAQDKKALMKGWSQPFRAWDRPPDLTQALAILIVDIVRSRQINRERQKQLRSRESELA